MRGRKPKLDNVIPMRGDGASTEEARRHTVDQLIRRLQPRDLTKDQRAEWRRVGRLLADPTVDRLKPRFVDVIAEYCRAVVRLRTLRDAMPRINMEIYRVEAGRNGTQVKTHPYVAQINESWRQWRSLVAMLGLSPADERNMLPGQGDLFDEADEYFR
ncbi:MAG: P27 family phage terminase small subunit [Bauldia sp.]|nr:P27 family phage terminase small subunit [Bauldia sp.]